MAIYHCSLKVFSRSEGHSAVAAAAYRAGAIIKDERAGRTHRYHKRTGVADTFILAPSSTPKNLLSRAILWNAAEASETRKNSRVAREVILALPHELSDKARAELSRDMGLYLIERYRVAVDVAIHSPVDGDGHDPRNHHAHLLFTTREVTKDGLGAKTRVLDDKVKGPQEIEIIREVWETLANDALQRAGFSDVQIDRRSLEEQGVDRIPQTHEGKASKNEQALQSLLAKDFQKADQEDDEGDSEEESSGEKSSSSGSSDNQNPKLKSKVREDHTGREIDYPSLDQEQTRSSFNAEIKELNEQRATFGDKPLKEQIVQLDRLMERLDKRIEKLQTLETKTDLKSSIKRSIGEAVKRVTKLITRRERGQALQAFTKQERQARTERQVTRYGRKYRTGLHAQIKEMKRQMSIVEAKKEDFRRYKSLVDKINREVKKHVLSIPVELKLPDQPKRQVTNKEVNLKLHLKAEMIRTNIPEKYRAPSPIRGERKTLKSVTAVNKILQTKSTPIKVDRDVSRVLKSTREFKPDKKAVTAVKVTFTKATNVKPDPSVKADYKQPISIKVKGIEKVVRKKQSPETKSARKDVHKSWVIPATEDIKPLQKNIDKKLKERRQVKAQAEARTKTQDNFSKAKEAPEKTTTVEAVIEKVRAEVKVRKEKLPPEHRAKPYEKTVETPKQESTAEEPLKREARTTFDQASSVPETGEEPKRPTMSSSFNMSSGAGVSDQEQPKNTPRNENNS